MSLRFKLLSLIGVCAIAFIAFALISSDTLNTVKINGNWYHRIVQGKDVIADILPPPEYIVEANLLVYQMMAETDPGRLQAFVRRSKQLREDYEQRHKYWQKNLPDGPMKTQLLVRSYQPAMAFFEKRDTEVIPLILHNEREKAREIIRNVLEPKYRQHRLAIDQVVTMATESLQQDQSNVKQIVGHRTVLLIIIGLCALGMIVICGFYVNYLSATLIGRISTVAKSLSSGGEQVASSATQLTVSSQQLAEGAAEQASAIEETSSSLEEMSSMTRQNAQHATEADSSTTQTLQVIEEAKGHMMALSTSMEEISEASEETQKIIKTIDEIAFQTNLLALNAAVEAARAGEAGAGFAVVAEEVRHLALRAAEAAKSTASLIEGTIGKVLSGSKIMAMASNAFEKVSTGAKKIGELVSAITGASNEQAQGIEQLSAAGLQMDKVTQQNSANADQLAAAAKDIKNQADRMKASVMELISIMGGNGDYEAGSRGKDLMAAQSPNLLSAPQGELY